MTQAHLDEVNSYLSTGIHKVDGWCIPQLWQCIWPLYREIGDGPIAEIGVFEGKFFTGLAKTFGPGGAHAAIDVFDMQEFNLDKAGVGKKDVFLKNVAAHGVDADRVTCFQRDSLTLNTRDTQAMHEQFGGFKFFSVDGCHEVLHTMHDARFAMSVTDPAGIITIDDYMNPNWPGVIEAVAKMYLLDEYPFVPLLFTCNKLFLCSRSYQDRYRQLVWNYVRTHFPKTRMKEVTRFGHRTLTVLPNMQVWSDIQDT